MRAIARYCNPSLLPPPLMFLTRNLSSVEGGFGTTLQTSTAEGGEAEFTDTLSGEQARR